VGSLPLRALRQPRVFFQSSTEREKVVPSSISSFRLFNRLFIHGVARGCGSIEDNSVVGRDHGHGPVLFVINGKAGRAALESSVTGFRAPTFTTSSSPNSASDLQAGAQPTCTWYRQNSCKDLSGSS